LRWHSCVITGELDFASFSTDAAMRARRLRPAEERAYWLKPSRFHVERPGTGMVVGVCCWLRSVVVVSQSLSWTLGNSVQK
jgi:hypothetical protein